MAQEKRENSVLFSLRELRQIEENRVQEEEHAVRTAEEQRLADQQARERAARDAEEARARAEREEQLRIEQAREGAEREARMRVESAEAAERQRQQAALEQQRLQQEMELRRAEVAKKRPTWMLAVTGLAVVMAVVLVFFAIQKMNQSDTDSKARKEAEIAAQQAINDAKEAKASLDKVTRDLDDLDAKAVAAKKAVDLAQNDADRANANAKLRQLQQEQADMRNRVEAAKQAAAKAERAKGVHISKECMENPLAKGC
jgi:hypothetical protein